ncbi:MFS-type transporter SLC18B1-like [Pollicipes pollicipes]|uniref:MFS-type transporter SLC18B1-like n=1 Tax=Pollicipes pollicipes TaxID=41117 RepID=UPI001884CED9|nr:MFS-type transporter SLC18B1-like [Pollicipes pollicipes]
MAVSGERPHLFACVAMPAGVAANRIMEPGPAASARPMTRRQWVTLLTFGLVDFWSAVCLSLQAPLFPSEAAKKGATASEYGLIFGTFELTKFIVCPLLGRYLHKIGPKVVFNGGIFITSSCAIAYGILDVFSDTAPFLVSCFVVRTIEACGYASFLTASFTIIAKEFPDNVATTFASLETFFGVGLIVGPMVGGALYQVGGYTLPFVTLGSILFGTALLTLFVLPNHKEQIDVGERKGGIRRALAVPDIAMAAFSITCASCSNGFIVVLLEPHLRPFGLSPVLLGLMFVITGAVYATCAPLWGWLCDRHVRPKQATAAGALLVAAGFSLLGPAPFLPLQPSLGVIAAALALHGVGFGAEVVAAFLDAHRAAIRSGFPDTVETYGTISGLWASMFALGAFVGPCLAGLLYDHFGFGYASLMIIVVHMVLFVAVMVFLCLPDRAIPEPVSSAPPLPDEKSPLIYSDLCDRHDAYGVQGTDNRLW